MTKKLLSWFGLLALLGLFGVSVAGLLLVKDRLHVVVQDGDGTGAHAQQIAQLRDEMGQMQRDVRALADALSKGLQQLGEEQAAEAAAYHAEIATRVDRAAESARALGSELAAARSEQLGTARALADLNTHLRAEHESAVAAVAVSIPPAPAAPAVTESRIANAIPSVTPRKRSAFAFDLPSQSFRFDREQRFELLPSLSRVGFDAKSTLHDFTGVTSKLEGDVQLNLAAPAAGCTGTIKVDARTLDTGLTGRNDAMREHLATEQHPEIVLAITSMTAGAVDPAKQTATGTVHGKMTIRGQTRAIAMPVRLSVDDSKRVHAKGEMRLELSDYGVPVPSQLGMIKMQSEVKVWIALQARALPLVEDKAR